MDLPKAQSNASLQIFWAAAVAPSLVAGAVLTAILATTIILKDLRGARDAIASGASEPVCGRGVAMRREPVVIIRHGQAAGVSYDEWERLSAVRSFGRLLKAAPLVAEDLPAATIHL